MRIMFSSKTVELTDRAKAFLEEKIDKLKKFPSLGIDQLQVIVDRVKRGGRNTSEAQVEVITQLKGARYAFKEVGDNLYQAFYRVFNRVEQKLGKEKAERGRR